MPYQSIYQSNNQQGGTATNSPSYSTQKPQNFLGDVFSKASDIFKGVGSAVGGFAKWAAPQILPVGGQILGKGIGMAIPAAASGVADVAQEAGTEGVATPVVAAELPAEGAAVYTGGKIGSGIGGAAGEFAEETIENVLGARKGYDWNKIGVTGAASTVADFASDAVFSQAAKDTYAKLLSFMSGGDYSPEMVKEVFGNPEKYVAGYKGGKELLQKTVQGAVYLARPVYQGAKDIMSDIVSTSGKKLGELSDTVLKDFGKKLATFADTPITPAGGDAKTVVNGLMDNVNKILSVFEIKPTQTWGSASGGRLSLSSGLQFGEPGTPTSLPAGAAGARGAIKDAYGLIQDLVDGVNNGKDLTAKMLETTRNALSNLRNFTKLGGDKDATAILGEMYHEFRGFIQDNHPQLNGLLEDVAPKLELLNNVRNVISQTGTMGAAKIDATKNKLIDIFQGESSKVLDAVKTFGNKVGVNFDNFAEVANYVKNLKNVIPDTAKISADEIDATAKKLLELVKNGKSSETAKVLQDFEKKAGTDIWDITEGAYLKDRGTGFGMTNMASIRSFIGKFTRPIPGVILKMPVKIAGMESTVGKVVKWMVDTGLNENAIRAYIQSFSQGVGKGQYK